MLEKMVRRGSILLTIACCLFLVTSSAVFAQDEVPTPKADIFGGYSWYNPSANLNGTQLKSMNQGAAATGTYNFSKYVGLAGDLAVHRSDQAKIWTVMGGPQLMWRGPQFQPFIEGMVGWQRLTVYGGPVPNKLTRNGPVLKVGGGFDIPITSRFSWRVIQADYVWSHQKFVPIGPRLSLPGAELRTGLVLNLGIEPPLPPEAAACSAAQPAAVMAGEPVSSSISVTNIPPKHTMSYDWKSSGGKVDAKGSAVTVDTTGLAPGQYTITATGTDSKPRKDQTPVSCTTQFTVNEPPKHPPTIACSASPTTVRAGDTSTITSTAGNPDNRTLTYSYTATAGRISGTGTTATLDTAGAPAGRINVSCSVTDDRGLSANSNTAVTVEAPPPPPVPQVSKLSDCDFPNKAKPWRVDNTCKAVLDDIALRMQREADAKLIIVGQMDPKEKPAALSAQRAVNSKAYLTSGEAQQQIDASRIETRTGTTGGQKAEFYLVPSGATYGGEGTQPVDESKVKAQGRGPTPRPRGTAKPAATPQR